jgi:ArsR family transcriptional regulator, virulence genes transcriptional regulator
MVKLKSKQASKGKGLEIQLEELKKAALTLRAINHKIRQNILNLIDKNKEITVSEIYYRLKLEQSLTSAHLAVLRKAGIVVTRRQGQSIHYSINYDHIRQIEHGAGLINGRSPS